MWLFVDLLFAAAIALVGLQLARTWGFAPAAPVVRTPQRKRTAHGARVFEEQTQVIDIYVPARTDL